MYYARFESADGAYADANGARYDVSEVRRVRNAHGVNVGYVPFPTLEAALEAWGLRELTMNELDMPEESFS